MTPLFPARAQEPHRWRSNVSPACDLWPRAFANWSPASDSLPSHWPCTQLAPEGGSAGHAWPPLPDAPVRTSPPPPEECGLVGRPGVLTLLMEFLPLRTWRGSRCPLIFPFLAPDEGLVPKVTQLVSSGAGLQTCGSHREASGLGVPICTRGRLPSRSENAGSETIRPELEPAPSYAATLSKFNLCEPPFPASTRAHGESRQPHVDMEDQSAATQYLGHFLAVPEPPRSLS